VETAGFVVGAVALVLAVWAEIRARRSERANARSVARREAAEEELTKSQRQLHELAQRLPELTAERVQSIFDLVPDQGADDDPRGWETAWQGRVGYANLTGREWGNDLLVEYGFGAHSAALLVLRHEGFDELEMLGAVFNGTGHRFHVRERSGGGGAEVVTLDYVEPLWDDRSLADMPVQPVYYRWQGGTFIETGRGEAWDPLELWSVPPSVLPLLNRRGLEEARQASLGAPALPE
jgi:hypothetical protein